MKTASSDLDLSQAQQDELEALAAMAEDAIDTREMPEQRDWRGAKRGVFFRPIKKQLTLRLDADVIGWFQARMPEGKGYQTGINEALREYVARHEDSK